MKDKPILTLFGFFLVCLVIVTAYNMVTDTAFVDSAFASSHGAVPETETEIPEGGAVLIPTPMYPEWEATGKEVESIPLIENVQFENPAERKIRLRKMKLGAEDINTPVLKLDSSLIVTDLYKPVRFMMKDHAVRMNKDCASCHHKTPAEMPTDMDDPRALETISCESCHQGGAVIEKDVDRLSLKAAYHQRCISCHKESNLEKAPVDCTGCHRRNIPNHENLFKVEGDPESVTPTQMTGLCLECHANAGDEMLKSAHYKWDGPVSEYTVLEKNHGKTGKRMNSINNNCISPFGDWAPCTKCHVGYGVREEDKEFSKNPENIDCLVCHAEEDTYAKGKKGMPAEDVDLVWVAGMVGKTKRSSCGECHYKAGGGNGKKGTLYNALNSPDRELDVHMGGQFDMSCADCHKGKQHKIPGRHSSVGVDEGIVECTDCHAAKPHANNLLAKHIDRHVDSVQCATCHVPTFSRAQQTRDMWDWRTVGESEEIIENEQGKPIYLPDEGTFRWKQNVKPHYDWDNGYTKRYVIGDVIEDMNKPVSLSRNLGDIADPDSKIGPFKLFQGWQPADSKYHYLVVPKNAGEDGIWETKEWIEPIKLGMEDVGLPFSGEITFVETELRFRPRHEVAPKENALTCVQCHSSALASEKIASNTCGRCHNEKRPDEIGEMISKGKGRAMDYFSWDELGYEKDPIKTGGRFRK